MADVVNFANFSQLSEMIESASNQVSGMTAAEAVTALNAAEVSGTYIYNAAQAAAGAENIIYFPNASSAGEAFTDFLASQGSTSGAGAAVSSSGSASAVADMIIGQSRIGQAATAVYGALSMSLPAAAAALAPLAGVSLGVGLYESNPELWEKISRTLLPFAYNDSQSIPAVVDKDGNTYFSKEMIDAFKNLIANENIGGEPSITGSPLPLPTGVNFPISINNDIAISLGSTLTRYTKVVDGTFKCCTKWDYRIYSGGTLMSSRNPFSFRSGYIESNGHDNQFPISTYVKPYTYDGKTIYWNSVDMLDFPSTPPIINPSGQNVTFTQELAWTLEYGDISEGGYPEGTSEWQGNPYPQLDPSSERIINIYNGPDSQGQPQYTPYYPVALPVGDPWVTSDPTVNPDPSTNPTINPGPVIEPWINPQVQPYQYPPNYPYPLPNNPPLPNPVPAPQPVPSPTLDPSRDPSQEPEPDSKPIPENPPSPTEPIDEGESPEPEIPTLPTLPSAASSLLHVYNPTRSQLDAFGAWLWTTFSGDLIDTLSKLFNDPMDAVIGLHELYATPSTQGSSTILAGFLDSEVPSALVGSRYTTINCGTVIVEEYWQNYLDYAPYTETYIYLPFVGIVRVNANDIIGNAVNIKYNIDSYTGCCIAIITVARDGYQSTVYQFEGNCAVEIPITSGYQSALMAGLISLAGTAIGANPVTGMLMSGRGSGVNQVQHSGSFGSSYGAMGAKIPYIIIKRPTQKVVENYSLSYGYPSHKMVFIGNCSGYIRALEVIATSSKATQSQSPTKPTVREAIL